MSAYFIVQMHASCCSL